jgi:hypothetical protein
MPTTYKFKIGLELVLPLAAILVMVSVMMVKGGAWPGLIINLIVAAFIAHMIFTTYYVLSDKELVIRCGFLINQTIKVDAIKRITETRNALSAPATSLDRIEIAFGKYDTLMVSPKNKAEFIAHLTQLKPGIEVKWRARK